MKEKKREFFQLMPYCMLDILVLYNDFIMMQWTLIIRIAWRDHDTEGCLGFSTGMWICCLSLPCIAGIWMLCDTQGIVWATITLIPLTNNFYFIFFKTFFFFFRWDWKLVFFFLEQSLATKLIVTLSYNLTQYLFIGVKFWEFYHWITSLLISFMLAKFLEN